MIDEPARRGTADRAGPGQDDGGTRHPRTLPHSARTGSAGDGPRCAAHSEVMRRPTFAVMSGLSAVVLALSYHSSTGTTAGTAVGSSRVSGSSGSSSGSSGSSSGSSGSSSGSSGSKSGSSSGTYTGNAVDTQWGHRPGPDHRGQRQDHGKRGRRRSTTRTTGATSRSTAMPSRS